MIIAAHAATAVIDLLYASQLVYSAIFGPTLLSERQERLSVQGRTSFMD